MIFFQLLNGFDGDLDAFLFLLLLFHALEAIDHGRRNIHTGNFGRHVFRHGRALQRSDSGQDVGLLMQARDPGRLS